MYIASRKTQKVIVAMLAVLLAVTGLGTPLQPAEAAVPASVPSQIAISIAGGADEGKSAMAINWVTDPSVNTSEIIYSTSPDLAGGLQKNASLKVPVAEGSIPDSKLVNFKAVNAFNVILQDLVPDNKYYYKVGNASSGYSEIASFTAPSDHNEKKPFSFVVSPDTQGTSPSSFANTGLLYDYIKANEPDAAFLLHNGDVVEDASFSDHWQFFFDEAQHLLDSLPIMATPGNHDGASYDRNFEQYNARFNYSSLRQPSGLSPAAAGTVYAFEYGDALIISLNSNVSTADNNIQYQFLAEEAAATSKAWKIVNIHASPYDPGASHYQVDNISGKRLTDAGIDLVLSGHEHAYARSTLKTTSSAGGTGSIQNTGFGEAPTYVIGGSVYNYAYSLDTRDTSWNDYFYDLRINKSGTGGGAIYSPGVYSKVEVTSNAIIYKAYYKATGADGPFRVIDSFTIAKSGETITQPIGGGIEPASVTFLLDSFQQDAGKFIARFNWVTPPSTKTTQLYYAKKSDFDSNGGKFTDVVVGTSSTIDLSQAIANANYNGAGTEYSVAPVQSHKAETEVLEPGTEYVYSVGDGARNVTNIQAPASFTTPAEDLDTFDFVWITDAQQNGSSYEATLKQYTDYARKALQQALLESPNASFVLSSGDQVNYGFDTWEWDAFFEANADTYSHVPLYMVTGNHEYDGAGNSWAPNNSWAPVDPTLRNLFGRYNPPQNGAAYYGGGDGTERMVAGLDKAQFGAGNYYFVYGDTLFLMMDYQDQSSSAQIKAQQDWMKSVVKQNPTKWRVAVLHKSLFGYRMANPVTSWTNAFDEAGVDLVLMGHDHVYVRTKLYANGGNIDPQAYGDGTTYITNYSANNDRRGAYFTKDPDTVAYVDVRPIGPGYANISISPSEIRVTSKGFDANGTLVVGDDDALITNSPRTPNLSAWTYPAVPQDDEELRIESVDVTGIAKEGQTLRASLTPSSATASIQWERSADGSNWATIQSETAAVYQIKGEDVGQFLRAVATGTGFYSGIARSSATAKVNPLAVGGSAAIKIGSAEELAALAEQFGSSDYPIDGHYVLTADIDMADVAFSAIGGGSTPTPFIGTFNGKGYTIRNLKIVSSANNTGFFAYLGTGGRIVNLALDQADITGAHSTGAIAGTSKGTIENSYVTGKVTGNGYTGGIVGLLHAGTLQNSFVKAEVNGNTVGGLLGGTNWNNSGSPLTERDTVTGNVIVNNYIASTVSGPAGGQYFGAILGDMGGSSGSLLQTFNGNAVVGEVKDAAPGKVAGYWSGSRPIMDANPMNFFNHEKLNTSGVPSSVVSAFAGKTEADFTQQAAFESLGWDFEHVWEWDATNQMPLPRLLATGDDEEDNFVTIIAAAGAGGTITPEGSVLVERGNSQIFTFTPNENYIVEYVKIDGIDNDAAAEAGEYTFELVTDGHTIEVGFMESVLSNNANLSEIMIDGTVLSGFSADKTTYNVSVSNNRTGVIIAAATADTNASYRIAGGDNLAVGINRIEITVTAEDGNTTKVYTILVTRAAAPSGGNGGGGITPPTPDTDSHTFPGGTGGSALFAGGAVTVTIPAGATEKQLTITVEKLLDPSGIITEEDILLSYVYEIHKNFTENFSKAISLTFMFDSRRIGHNQTASLFYFDETNREWIEVGGAMSGDKITAEIDHFAKFAVFAVEKPEETPGTEPEESSGGNFNDISGHWAEAFIKRAAIEGIIKGYEDGAFRPGGEVSRAEFAVMLARALKLRGAGAALTFTDNESFGAWARQGIAQAVEAGIITGYDDGSFRPNARISRAEMAAMIARALSQQSNAAVMTSFGDDAEIPGWAKSSIAFLAERGIVQGTGSNTFAPDKTANRAEAAVIMLRTLEYSQK